MKGDLKNIPIFPSVLQQQELVSGTQADLFLKESESATLLDHFAGQAMQADIASSTTILPKAEHVAERAYKYAEAMLKERLKYIQ